MSTLSDLQDGKEYVVGNENTLGFIYKEQPELFQILDGSALRGSTWTWRDGYTSRGCFQTIRPATRDDFEAFRSSLPRDFEEWEQLERTPLAFK